MKSLEIARSLPRFAAARLAAVLGSGRGAGIGPLRLVEGATPELPGADWSLVHPRLSGICGSDLSTIDGRTSRYFEALVSFPFVPGHEVVATMDEPGRTAQGSVAAAESRVVLEPVLGCVARGIEPRCAACATGRTGDCEHVAFGHLSPGLQTGFCCDTGGGWSAAGIAAHESQLHLVPEAMSDEDAVTVEPLACAIHAVLGAGIDDGDVVAVIGAGTLGLLVTAAAGHLSSTGAMATPASLLVGARYVHQRRWAERFGATGALDAEQLARAVRRRSRSLALGASAVGAERLTGGADIVFDCVGSAASIEAALDMVRPRGRVVLVGMPGRLHLDLAALWHREVALVGAYAYGTEKVRGEHGPTSVRTFDLAFEAAAALGTGRLVSATYPIERFEEALAHAGAAGRRGAVKIAFDLRSARRGTTKGPTT